jgi:hypothetical protein
MENIMKVTVREAKMLNNIANSCYGDFSTLNPEACDSQTWAFEACDNNFGFTAAEKGVLSSLVKKELVIVRGWRDSMNDDTTIEFTEAGVKAWESTL